MDTSLPNGRSSTEPPDHEMLEILQNMFACVRQGATEQLEVLLRRGVPANLLNQKGDSLIMLASYHGHLGAARLLLSHGADPDLFNDQGQSPLMGAVFKGNLLMAELLLTCGAHVNSAAPDGKTALMTAAMFNRTDMVEFLLSQGARLDVRDARGLSPADVARIMGAAETAAQLDALA